MPGLMRSFPVLIAATALAACSGKAPAPEPTGSASAQPSAPAAPAAPPASAAEARKVSEASSLYEFDYAYPREAAAIPALKDWLDKDLDAAKASLIADAREGRKEAKDGGFPYNAYSASKDWQVVTDLPGWLSLSTIVGSYTGGAHPNYVFDTVLWDKAANVRRQPLDLFTSKAAFKAAILKPFCAGLDKERIKKRGSVDYGTEWEDDMNDFVKCVDPLEQVVILGSKGRKGFDRVGFLIAPYNAGPYAEGDYEVTVPVTPAVLAAVKPEFRTAFAAP